MYMTPEEKAEYRRSQEWKNKSNFRRHFDGNLCQNLDCQYPFLPKFIFLHVHHLYDWCYGEERLDDIKTYCPFCHLKFEQSKGGKRLLADSCNEAEDAVKYYGSTIDKERLAYKGNHARLLEVNRTKRDHTRLDYERLFQMYATMGYYEFNDCLEQLRQEEERRLRQLSPPPKSR